MPIDVIGARYRELGRLRLGEDLGDRPTALEVWRLTSPHADLLEAASELYGGSVDTWQDGYELTTTTAELPVLVPAQDVAAGQWLELWQGSTIARRCNGTELVSMSSSGEATILGPCQCDPEARDCKPTTVLRVVIPDLPDLGVWRLVTHSVYAAIELPGAVTLLVRAHGGELAPATIAIESRRGTGRRPFMVPVLRSPLTLTELTELEVAGPSLGTGRLESSASASLDGPHLPQPAPLAASEVPALEAAGASATTDEDAPHGDEQTPGPSVPPIPKRAQWEDLGRLLRSNLPTNLPKSAPELISVLVELEELMLETRLWPLGEVDPLDAAAAKHHSKPWRQLEPAGLDTFAKRALMVAGTLYADHRFGRLIISELDLEEATG